MPQAKHKKVRENPVPRNCLRCARKFTAEGRFVRICNSCKEGKLWKAGPEASDKAYPVPAKSRGGVR